MTNLENLLYLILKDELREENAAGVAIRCARISTQYFEERLKGTASRLAHEMRNALDDVTNDA